MDTSALYKKLDSLNPLEYEKEVLIQGERWRKEIEEAEALKAIGENFIIKDLLKRYSGQMEDINKILLERYEMTELERKVLLKTKELYRDFINSFDADAKLQSLAEQINEL